MRDDQIKYMVERFLGWRLPEGFNPDAGISFKPTFNEHTDHPMRHEPTGTNLFDATQAEVMIRYLVDGLPKLEAPDEPYFVEVEENGCSKCGAGRLWCVVGPDGARGSTSYGDEEAAQDLCDEKNDSFAAGRESAVQERDQARRERDEALDKIKELESSEYDQKAVSVIQNLAMLVRRLAHKHPNEKLAKQATNYLLGEGLQGDILRAHGRLPKEPKP